MKYKYSDRAIAVVAGLRRRALRRNTIDICGNVYGTWPLQAEQNHVHVHSRQPQRSTIAMPIGRTSTFKPAVHLRAISIRRQIYRS